MAQESSTSTNKWEEWYKSNDNFISKEDVRKDRKLCVFKSIDEKNRSKYAFFIHGACARMGQLEHQIAYFRDELECNVIAFDRIGCGKSSKPNDWNAYSDSEIFQDLCALFEKYIPKSTDTVKNNKNDEKEQAQEKEKEKEKKEEKEKEKEKEKESKSDDNKNANENENENKNDCNNSDSENSIFIVSHSYGTSQTVRLCAKYLNSGLPYKYNIKGIVLMGMPAIGNQLKDNSNSAPLLFYLPETVLGWIQPSLSKGFRDRALHEKSSTECMFFFCVCYLF